MRNRVLAGILTGTFVAFVPLSLANADIPSAIDCTYSFTDCFGGQATIAWTCEPGTWCCVTVYYDFENKCISGVAVDCCVPSGPPGPGPE